MTAFTSGKTPAAQAAAIAAKPIPYYARPSRPLADTGQPFYALYGQEGVQGVLNAGASPTEADVLQMYAVMEQAQV